MFTHTQAPLTRRQVAARKRAAEIKKANAAAKAWLTTRKGSQTPVADRLIAPKVAIDNWKEAGARAVLYDCLRYWETSSKRRYFYAHRVSHELLGWRFTTQSHCMADAVALMKEAGVPKKYWQASAAKLAAQAAAKPAPQIEEAKAENVTAFKRKPRAPKPAPRHPWRRALLQAKAA